MGIAGTLGADLKPGVAERRDDLLPDEAGQAAVPVAELAAEDAAQRHGPLEPVVVRRGQVREGRRFPKPGRRVADRRQPRPRRARPTGCSGRDRRRSAPAAGV